MGTESRRGGRGRGREWQGRRDDSKKCGGRSSANSNRRPRTQSSGGSGRRLEWRRARHPPASWACDSAAAAALDHSLQLLMSFRSSSTSSSSIYSGMGSKHSTAQHSSAQLSTAQHSSAQLSTAQHSSAQLSTAQLSSAQLSTAQHSSAQQGIQRHGHADAPRLRCQPLARAPGATHSQHPQPSPHTHLERGALAAQVLQQGQGGVLQRASQRVLQLRTPHDGGLEGGRHCGRSRLRGRHDLGCTPHTSIGPKPQRLMGTVPLPPTTAVDPHATKWGTHTRLTDAQQMRWNERLHNAWDPYCRRDRTVQQQMTRARHGTGKRRPLCSTNQTRCRGWAATTTWHGWRLAPQTKVAQP